MEFKIGDKNVWRGRTVLFKGVVKRITPKTLVVTDLEDNEGVTDMLYTYQKNKEMRTDKVKAMLL